MACYEHLINDWDLSIPSYKISNGVTYYDIRVRMGEICWSVKHRFRDFVSLNNVLSSDNGFSKDLLPPKKYFGKQDEVFLESRRKLLEEYLRRTFSLLKTPLPRIFVAFLNIDYFDIFYILESIPPTLQESSLAKEPAIQIQNDSIPTLSLLQVHALRRCLKLPQPSSQVYNLEVECSDILELCGSLECLCIEDKRMYTLYSNLRQDMLQFDLSVFKSLKHLTLLDIPLCLLTEAIDLRRGLSTVTVINCDMKSPAGFLFCDQLHKESHNQVAMNTWEKLTAATMNFNKMEFLGDSLSFTPRLKRLDLKNNSLSVLEGFDRAKELQHLNVCNNLLSDLSNASSNLKSLTSLDLSGNRITSLKGLEGLTKLTCINLSFNSVNDFAELKYVSKLPILGYIVLTGNPLSKIVDYRVKVLLEFGDGHRRLQLDHEETTQKELDRVAVLLALKHVENEKSINR